MMVDGKQILTEQQAVIAASAAVTQDALTDNGGGTADGTVAAQAAPTAPTNSTGEGTHDDTIADGLTVAAFVADNGGGTADGTVAAQAAPDTIVDNSGLDATHDDTIAATAAIVALTDNSGGSGTHDDTVAAITPAAAITDNSGGVDPANDTIAVIDNLATVCQISTLFNVAAAAAAADQLDIAAAVGAETMANLVQPSHPRNIVLTPTDAAAGAPVLGGTVTVVGTAPDGSAASEVLTIAESTAVTGSVIFATVTSITLTTVTGNGAGDTLDAAWGVKLGVPVIAGSTGLSIKRLVVDGTAEAAAATDTTNNSFTATTAPNGAHDYEVWFTVSSPAITAAKAAIAQLAAKQNTTSTAVGVLKQNQSDVTQKVIELVTREGVTAQNVSDLAQKNIELVTLAGVAQNNLKECTDKIASLITDMGVQNQNDADLAEKVIELITLAGTAQNNLKEITTELAKVKTDNAAQKTTLDAVVAMLKVHGLIASA
jgi:hypothetical protein